MGDVETQLALPTDVPEASDRKSGLEISAAPVVNILNFEHLLNFKQSIA